MLDDRTASSGSSRLLLPTPLRRSFGFHGLAFAFRLLRLTGTLLLGSRCFLGAGRGRAIDQLHQRHRRGVTRTRQHPEYPGVSAWTGLEARTEVFEQLLDHIGIAQAGKRQAAIRVAVDLGESDERL